MARKQKLFDVRIDPEFERLIDPLTDEEYAQLKENIREYGLQEKILVWREPGAAVDLIVDGHNRYHVLTELSQESDEYAITDDCFTYGNALFFSRDEVREYMIKNQLGRRNLTPFQRTELALKLKPVIAEKAKKNQSTHTADGYQGLENSSKAVDTRQEIAKAAKVSTDTVRKVETILEKASEEDKEKLRNGETSINRVFKIVSGNEKKEPLHYVVPTVETDNNAKKRNSPFDPEHMKKQQEQDAKARLESMRIFEKGQSSQKPAPDTTYPREGFIAKVPEENLKEYSEIAEVHMERLCLASTLLKNVESISDVEMYKTLSNSVVDAMWYFHIMYGVPLGNVDIHRTAEGNSEAVLIEPHISDG